MAVPIVNLVLVVSPCLMPSHHVCLIRVQQTVSGNKPSQYPPDTIRWTHCLGAL